MQHMVYFRVAVVAVVEVVVYGYYIVKSLAVFVEIETVHVSFASLFLEIKGRSPKLKSFRRIKWGVKVKKVDLDRKQIDFFTVIE